MVEYIGGKQSSFKTLKGFRAEGILKKFQRRKFPSNGSQVYLVATLKAENL